MVLKQSKEAMPNIIWILDSLQSRLKTKTKKNRKMYLRGLRDYS